MIVRNPTVDDLSFHFPNLNHALGILINGLRDKEDPEYVLWKYSDFRKKDTGYFEINKGETN